MFKKARRELCNPQNPMFPRNSRLTFSCGEGTLGLEFMVGMLPAYRA